MLSRISKNHRVGWSAAAVLGLSLAVAPFAWIHPAGAAVHRQVECTITVNDDAYQTPENTPLTVEDPGVVTNDQICGTDGLVISNSSPTHGTLSGFDDSGGGFTYTPDAGFTGTDSFTYSLEDVTDSPMATVTITVTAPATTTTTTPPTTTTTPPATIPAAAAVQATPVFTG